MWIYTYVFIHTQTACFFLDVDLRGVGSGEDVKAEGKIIRKRGRLGDQYYQRLLHICVTISQT